MAEPMRNDKRYTYADYLTWGDDVRCELIDGIAYAMSPAPKWEHQSILVELCRQLSNFLKNKHCKVFAAPFDVRLDADGYDDTVVQPDIVVLCDRSKLSGTGCTGAPDLIIEILSPSSMKTDKVLKFNKYMEAGVREYWIVDPESATVSVYVLQDGEYRARAYGEADLVNVYVLEGCVINLADVFAQ